MVELSRRITDSDAFASGVAMLIVANAMALGLETVDAFAHDWHEALFVFFWASQALFVAEIALRLAAAEGGWRGFWADRWNRFDAVVVAVSLLPVAGALAPLARLFRVLRVLRLVSAFGSLRELVEQGGVTGGAVGPLAVVLGGFWYVAAIAGYTLFAELDPGRWGHLYVALRSVFFLTVLTDVSAIATPVTDASMAALGYFVAFYLVLAGIALRVLSAVVRGAGSSPEVQP
jgi:voltage-gated sodium channel